MGNNISQPKAMSEDPDTKHNATEILKPVVMAKTAHRKNKVRDPGAGRPWASWQKGTNEEMQQMCV